MREALNSSQKLEMSYWSLDDSSLIICLQGSLGFVIKVARGRFEIAWPFCHDRNALMHEEDGLMSETGLLMPSRLP